MKALAPISKYDAYKDSGVDWLGDIPKNWLIIPTKRKHRVLKLINKRNQNKNVLSLTLRGVVNNSLDNPEGLVPSDYASYQIFEKDDLVFKLIDLENLKTSRVGIVHEQGVMSPAYIRLTISEQYHPKYVFYYFYNLYLNAVYNNLGQGVRSTLGPSDLLEIPIIEPTYKEQTAIANFLDKKTAQIDEAIAIKEKQIALLKERKQIIIQKAVTQGLDPKAPMKDSGVDWIGQIPEHWSDPIKMKFISSLKGRQGWQGLKAEEYTDVGPHVLSSAHFNNYIIDWDKCPRVSMERYLMDENIQLKVGDILLMKDGANMGKLAYVDILPGPACLNSHLLLFRPYHENGEPIYHAKYMFFHMMCNDFQDYVKVNGTGATFLGISQESIGNYAISFPSLNEQKEITQYLETKRVEYDSLVTHQKKQIEKLEEYKTTLINSAVTGKIKVA